MEWLGGVFERWVLGRPAVDWTTYDFGQVLAVNEAAHAAARAALREKTIAALEKIIATVPDVDAEDTYVELPRDEYGSEAARNADVHAVYNALVAENSSLKDVMHVDGSWKKYIRIRW
jgi:hypothetical protein